MWVPVAGGVVSPSDIGPIPVGSWAFAFAMESPAAAATVVASSCAMTTPEPSIQTAHNRTSRSVDLLAAVIVAGDFRRGCGSARSEQYGTGGGTGSSKRSSRHFWSTRRRRTAFREIGLATTRAHLRRRRTTGAGPEIAARPSTHTASTILGAD